MNSHREIRYRLYSFQKSLDTFSREGSSQVSDALESRLINGYMAVQDALNIVSRLGCTDAADLHTYQQHFVALERQYYTVETTRFDHHKVLHDYLHYKQSFIAFFQCFTPMDTPDGDEAGEICNALYRRSFMEHVLIYLRQHDYIEYDQEAAELKAILYAQYPQAAVEKLGSMDDRDYQCMLLIPTSHWWFYREGYQHRSI